MIFAIKIQLSIWQVIDTDRDRQKNIWKYLGWKVFELKDRNLKQVLFYSVFIE